MNMPVSTKVTIELRKSEADEIQKWLDSDEPIPDAGQDEIVKTWTANFGNHIFADIKLCNTKSGPYLDCILFHDGNEVVLQEPQYVLLGSYPFEYEGITYELIITT